MNPVALAQVGTGDWGANLVRNFAALPECRLVAVCDADPARLQRAAQDPADPGVLILSTLAGAARELTTALLVNPYDTRGMAHAIQQAFNMPLSERRDRHQAMLEVLRRNSIDAWHSSFVQTLESCATPQLKRRTG